MGKFFKELFKKGVNLEALAARLKDSAFKMKQAAVAEKTAAGGWSTKTIVYSGIAGTALAVTGWLGYNAMSDVKEQIPFTENSCDRGFEALIHQHFKILEEALGANAAIGLVGFIRLISAAPPGTVKIGCDEFLTNYIVGLDLNAAIAWRSICTDDGDPSFAAYRSAIESAADLAAKKRGSDPNRIPPGGKNELEDLLEEESSGKKEVAPPSNNNPIATTFDAFWQALIKVGTTLGYTPDKKAARKAFDSAKSDQRPFSYEASRVEDLALVKEGIKGLFAIKGGDLLRQRPAKEVEESNPGVIKDVPPYKLVTGFVSARAYTLVKSTLPSGTKMSAIMPFLAAFYKDNILENKKIAMSMEAFADALILGKDLSPAGTIKLRFAQSFSQARFKEVSKNLTKSEMDSAISMWKQYVRDNKNKPYLGIVSAEEAWGKKINEESRLA